MAFLKYAKARIVTPEITFGISSGGWSRIRQAAALPSVSNELMARAEDILGEKCTPDRYLLTHSTIVCSVDTEKVKGSKMGSVEEEGAKILRKYPDYRITSNTDRFINNNLDSWSRGVLKKSYRSFIGAFNFVEHIQVEELSKGRIIDAVLRDVGDSLYVDILVATDKKHADLVEQIQSGKMNAMSMGCSVDFTICSKCGHVAADETEMCRHIRYEKGNIFYDERGDKHRIAELCGHEDEGDNGGVTFIEASWVATPAFEGAVARNTLEAPQAKVASQILSVEDRLNAIPSEWLRKDAGMFDDDDEGEDEGSAAPEVPASILDQLEESVTKAVVDRIRRKIEDEIEGKGKEEAPSTSDSTVSQNDTIVKEGSRGRYFRDLGAALKIATSDRDALNNILILNRHYGVEIPSRIYLLADRMGSANKYPSLDIYLAKAQEIIGTQLSEKDSLRLVRLAKLLNNRAGCPTYPTKGR